MKEIYAILIVFGLVGTVAITFGIFNAQAQVEPTDRFFEKDFCNVEENILDDITYTNGAGLSYDSTGCPISQKIIHNWDNLSVSSQNQITVRLATNGYEDVTDTIEQTIQ